MKSVDGTIPVQALLLADEQLITSQQSVGLYLGHSKSANHSSGTAHLTSHRIIYVDYTAPPQHSIQIQLSRIKETEYYAGFLKSNPKVTLWFHDDDDDNPEDDDDANASPSELPSRADRWTCSVCDESNLGGSICALCGISRDVSGLHSGQDSAPPSRPLALSGSLPSNPLPIPDPTPKPASSSDEISCKACTFLNNPLLKFCELCGTPLAAPIVSVAGGAKSAPISRASTPSIFSGQADEDARKLMKISFRKGGDKQFYALLKRSLHSKAWATPSPPPPPTSDSRAGIQGVISNLQTTSTLQSNSISTALADLDTLAIKAREMVNLAQTFNAKLARSDTEGEDEKFVRKSLMSLGLDSTANTSVGSGGEEDMMRELASVCGRLMYPSVRGVMMDKEVIRGVVGLDEVWGAWMRTRGVSLLPPSTLPPLLPQLEKYTHPPLHVRTLQSGVSILVTSEYTHASFTARLLDLLTASGGMTTLEIALKETAQSQGSGTGVGVGVVEGMIMDVESSSDIVRDDGGGEGGEGELGGAGVKWWRNEIRDWVWDGDA